MAIKVIVELHAAPGRRDELKDLLERLIAAHKPGISAEWDAPALQTCRECAPALRR